MMITSEIAVDPIATDTILARNLFTRFGLILAYIKPSSGDDGVMCTVGKPTGKAAVVIPWAAGSFRNTVQVELKFTHLWTDAHLMESPGQLAQILADMFQLAELKDA